MALFLAVLTLLLLSFGLIGIKTILLGERFSRAGHSPDDHDHDHESQERKSPACGACSLSGGCSKLQN